MKVDARIMIDIDGAPQLTLSLDLAGTPMPNNQSAS